MQESLKYDFIPKNNFLFLLFYTLFLEYFILYLYVLILIIIVDINKYLLWLYLYMKY